MLARPRPRAVALAVAGLVSVAGATSALAQVEASARPRVLLWEIRKPSPTSGTLYLLGATHVGRAAIERFDPVIETAFDRSQKLALEADLLASRDPAFRRFMMEIGGISDGSTLADRLPLRVHQDLRRVLSRRGMRPDVYERFEPWLVALMVSGDALSRHGYRPSYGMGRYFVERRRARPIVELEGARPQIEALDRLDADLQELMLREALDGLPDLDRRLERIAALWSTGDADGLADVLFRERPSSPERERFLERMYFARNRGMADRLEEPLRRGQVWFAVVGAGHVVGERGIPALLSDRGYRVRQLAAAPVVSAVPASAER